MTPTGGYYIIIHLLVLIGAFMVRLLRRLALPTAILGAVFLLVGYGAYAALSRAYQEGSSLDLYEEAVMSCESAPRSDKEAKIVIRIDDIQAYWLRDLQIRLLEELKARNLPAVLAVIPLGLEEDRTLYRYLRRNRCWFELALHGYDQGKASNYQEAEFATLDEKAAGERIDLGAAVLTKLSGSAPTTFVPPNNSYSTGTEAALIARGFSVVSAEQRQHPFDYTVGTFDYVKEVMNPVEGIVRGCRAKLDAKLPCIVMIHPQDYISHGEPDEDKYRLYLDLLDALQQLDVAFVTPRDLTEYHGQY